MNGAASHAADYAMPQGVLGLKGPVRKPAPGTLPLRGDLAHIALAGTHLAAHYVIPELREIGAGGAALHLMPRDDSDISQRLEAGTRIEVLDVAGAWAWGCLGPQGPSGYLKLNELA
ncbi:hypothetical protein [Erythrobacter sp. JK5]|uniref:hypothetical protein n=1 Tax=Erythrobacter sp. JK5 TaxID=2829500 RepID=UPI001BAB6995|nr:hypothetical protein [Erythrobacter sp. JK5]QUL36569.1 hypothetical protein KDC96_08955 [Erythrobacter sp. JK5]